MALGIYKQGQGYWIRLMTAVFVGILVLAGAAWGWSQAGAVRIPARSWTYSLVDTQVNADSLPGAGETVVLMGYVGVSDELQEIGRGAVEEFTPERGSSSTLVISGFDSDATRDTAGDAERVVVTALDTQTGVQSELMGAAVRSATSTPIFPVQYLQTGVAAGMMLIGSIFLYWYVGVARRPVEFLIASDGEMKKVNWTSYREVKGSTIVVIVATFLIAGILYLVDMGFSFLFSTIGVLER